MPKAIEMEGSLLAGDAPEDESPVVGDTSSTTSSSGTRTAPPEEPTPPLRQGEEENSVGDANGGRQGPGKAPAGTSGHVGRRRPSPLTQLRNWASSQGADSCVQGRLVDDPVVTPEETGEPQLAEVRALVDCGRGTRLVVSAPVAVSRVGRRRVCCGPGARLVEAKAGETWRFAGTLRNGPVRLAFLNASRAPDTFQSASLRVRGVVQSTRSAETSMFRRVSLLLPDGSHLALQLSRGYIVAAGTAIVATVFVKHLSNGKDVLQLAKVDLDV
jgi:hypothetical protein